MSFLKYFIASIVIFLTPFVFADENANQQNYKVVTISGMKAPAHKILMYDFFSYGCPHCYHLQPYLNAWLKQNDSKISHNAVSANAGQYIIYNVVPVTFDPGWDIYSKAYHIAANLKLENVLGAKIFDVAQNPLLGLNSDAQLKSFFLNNGVSEAAFAKASENLTAELKKDQELMQKFKLTEIPTVFIVSGNNVYMVGNSTVQGADPQKLIETLTRLTNKKP